ncbi:MAG: hypothetical protein AAF623_14055 [Planctomycetota bacterium]
MAARENQGYLIAVIVLVLLTLVLALVSFLGLSKASEHLEAKNALEDKNKSLKALSDSYFHQGEILKAMVGDQGISIAEIQTNIDSIQRLSSSDPKINDILVQVQAAKEAYDADMVGSKVSDESGEPVKEPTYREKLRNLSQIVAKKVSEYAIQVNQTKQAEKEAQTRINSMQKELTANVEAKNKAETDLAETKRLSLEKEQTLKEQVHSYSVSLDESKKEYESFQQKSAAEKRDLVREKNLTLDENEKLKTKINRYEREVFDRPDGTIVKVLSRSQDVFINLGVADGLTRNMTFSVYDQSITNFEENNHKATIEVTAVNEFNANARITMEDPVNPILAGDHILTATWDPGYPVPIALAGRFDLDGDKYDDIEKLARMIERNGGKVVAKHDPEGNMTGKIDANVRYLVLGDEPELGPNGSPGVLDTMKDMESMAEKNTVQVIDLYKLLQRMGVRAKPKTVQLNSPVGDFQTREPSDSLKSSDR